MERTNLLFQRKKIVIICSAIILLLFGGILASCTANASELTDFVANMVYKMASIGGDMAPTVSLIISDSIDKILYGNIDFFNTLANVVGMVAMTVLIVKTIIELIHSVAYETFTIDRFLKVFVRMCGAALLIFYSPTIAGYIAKACTAIMQEIVVVTHDYDLQAITENLTWYEGVVSIAAMAVMSIGIILTRIIAAVCLALVALAISVASWGIVVEICVRMVLMPFSLISFMDGGTRSPGFRFIKKFAATCLRMIVYVFVFSVVDWMTITTYQAWTGEFDIFPNFFTWFASLTAWKFYALAIARKSNKLTDDILGV